MQTADIEQRDFWIKNLREAHRMMSSKSDEQVDFDRWVSQFDYASTCGTIACLGGWCTVDPYFRSLGVLANFSGAPYMASPYYKGAWGVARRLFGDEDIFDGLRESEIRQFGCGRDRDVALHRIETRLAELGAAL